MAYYLTMYTDNTKRADRLIKLIDLSSCFTPVRRPRRQPVPAAGASSRFGPCGHPSASPVLGLRPAALASFPLVLRAVLENRAARRRGYEKRSCGRLGCASIAPGRSKSG